MNTETIGIIETIISAIVLYGLGAWFTCFILCRIYPSKYNCVEPEIVLGTMFWPATLVFWPTVLFLGWLFSSAVRLADKQHRKGRHGWKSK